jgi:hypothetical protein
MPAFIKTNQALRKYENAKTFYFVIIQSYLAQIRNCRDRFLKKQTI